MMHLPNEIILLILRSLEKHDLKSARLVSKTWTSLAAEFLFDQVYVSVHPENLEVFSAIARHPLLSQCIKTLRYDAVEFVEACTKEQYFWRLWYQMRRHFWYSYSDLRRLDDFALVPDYNAFRKIIASFDYNFSCPGSSGIEIAWEHCKDCDFISFGYQKYRKSAALQRAQLSNGTFLESLVGGLQTLKNLSCIIVDGQWSFSQKDLHPKKLFLKRPTGSPLSRDWNLFHTCPQVWEFLPHQYIQEPTAKCEVASGVDRYWTIVAALLRSQRKIQTFKTANHNYYCFPPIIFDRTRKESISFYGLDIVAFSELQVLKLSIAQYGDVDTPELFPNIDGLRFLLRSMHHLRVLDLDLPDCLRDKLLLYKSSQVFPQDGQWNRLTSLSLYGISSSAAEFLTLIIRRMPALSCLQLEMIELDIGDWEGVIECMKYSMHLSRFDVTPHTHLYHRGAIEFFGCRKHGPQAGDVKRCVESGGRHPCLRPDQSDSAAMLYITPDIQDFYMPIPTHTLPES